MNWNGWIRQAHRWLSIAFTLAVIVNFLAVGMKRETALIGFSALLPLAVLLLTGLYLFALPYVVRFRGRR